MQTFVDILKSKTPIVHFSLVFLIAFITCALLYILIFPLTYWSLFGEGAESERIESLPFNVFIANWSALILVLSFIFTRLYTNIKTHNLARVKSYLLTSFMIIVLYLFRNQIGNFLLYQFQ